MQPRVHFAFFCRHLTVNERGLTTISDLVHILTVQPTAQELYLVASVEGPPNAETDVSLRLNMTGESPLEIPKHTFTFGIDGFSELKAQLPAIPLFAAGTFSVELIFGDAAEPAATVAVRIATAPGGASSIVH